MAVTYYLLLQDRVAEALRFFQRVDATKLQTQLQYDYFAVYLAFSQKKLTEARTIAEKYKDYCVPRWQKIFQNVIAQLDEIEGKSVKVTDTKDRLQRQTRLAESEASFDFKVESRKINITYQHINSFRINYYLMDIELLFSRNPFVQQHSGQFAYIRPNLTQAIVASTPRKISFALPASFHSSNVMIEIVAEGIKKVQAYYAHSLDVQLIETYGQLTVAHLDTQKPLSRVYVKVYARMQNGAVQFYKDSYTDLRGRFDYASLNTGEIDQVARYAILVMSEKDGAVVREASPPKR